MRGGLRASLPPNDQPWLAPKDSIARPNHMQLCIISHATMAMASKHPLRFNEFISLSLFRVYKDPLHSQKELVSSLVVSSRPIFFLLW